MSNVGRLLYGFCNGFFGRDSYNTKRIEAEGVDWIVARQLTDDAMPEFAQFKSEDQKLEYIVTWSSEKERKEWAG